MHVVYCVRSNACALIIKIQLVRILLQENYNKDLLDQYMKCATSKE